MKQCKKIPVYANAVQLLACGIGCAAFTFMFGGHLRKHCMHFCRLIEQLALFVCRKRKVSRFLTNVYVSLLISLLSLPAAAGVIPVLHDKVVIGQLCR